MAYNRTDKTVCTENKKYIDKYTLSTLAPYVGTDIYNNPKKYNITWMETDYDKFLLYEDDVVKILLVERGHSSIYELLIP